MNAQQQIDLEEKAVAQFYADTQFADKLSDHMEATQVGVEEAEAKEAESE